MTAIDLLYGDAAPAKKILAEFKPAMTKDGYLAFERGLFPHRALQAGGVYLAVPSRPVSRASDPAISGCYHGLRSVRLSLRRGKPDEKPSYPDCRAA
jgi:hypothetical protein